MKAPIDIKDAPETWEDFPWPDWVPYEVRRQIEGFWSEFGRVPADYLRACEAMPGYLLTFGAVYSAKSWRTGTRICGRWVHCWGNIGRLVHLNGYECSSLADSPKLCVVPYRSARQKLADRYREHAKDIDRMGLRLTRARDISAEYEYHACVDGALLCDYIGDYSIRTLAGSQFDVSDLVECPTCLVAAEELDKNDG